MKTKVSNLSRQNPHLYTITNIKRHLAVNVTIPHSIQPSSMPKVKPKAEKIKTSHADIFMSIKPEHIANIASRLKNHEYRRYLLPSSVRRIWFYTSSPISSIHYVARISSGKAPGQVPEDGGIGNKDFNAGKKVSKYGYEILELWKLERPISLQQAKAKGYLKGPPQKYCWVPQVAIENCPLDKQNNIFTTGAEASAEQKKISDFLASETLHTQSSPSRGDIPSSGPIC
jgi:predicted transcriptional regulator